MDFPAISVLILLILIQTASCSLQFDDPLCSDKDKSRGCSTFQYASLACDTEWGIVRLHCKWGNYSVRAFDPVKYSLIQELDEMNRVVAGRLQDLETRVGQKDGRIVELETLVGGLQQGLDIGKERSEALFGTVRVLGQVADRGIEQAISLTAFAKDAREKFKKLEKQQTTCEVNSSGFFQLSTSRIVFWLLFIPIFMAFVALMFIEVRNHWNNNGTKFY